MKCSKCDIDVDKNCQSCPKCGGELIKKKVKFSVVTIISLILFILTVVIPLITTVYCMAEASKSSNDGYGWLMAIVLILSCLTIPYYGTIFVASIICDHKVKNKKLVKNIILIFFLLLPFLWLAKEGIKSYFDSKKLDYEMIDVSVVFPSDMQRGSTAIDFDGKYSNVEFVKGKCSIRFAVSEYDNSISLIENFKDKSDRFTIIKNNPNTIYEDFDTNYNLVQKDINGKNWDLYEKEYSGINYKLYGIKIDNNFYKLEIEDTGSSECSNLTNDVMTTVKYK